MCVHSECVQVQEHRGKAHTRVRALVRNDDAHSYGSDTDVATAPVRHGVKTLSYQASVARRASPDWLHTLCGMKEAWVRLCAPLRHAAVSAPTDTHATILCSSRVQSTRHCNGCKQGCKGDVH